MTTYGLTTSGFVLKRLSDIVTSINEKIQASLGEGVNLDARSPLGMLVGIFASALAEAWEGEQGSYLSGYPETAEGVNLDRFCAINNVTRKPATYSFVDEEHFVLIGDPGTVIPAGLQVHPKGNASAIFQTSADVTLDDEGKGTAYIQATTTGPLVAAAGSLTELVTPISGLTSVNNTADATLGENIEDDADLRARRLNELQRAGTSTIEGIRNAVWNVINVSQVGLIENATDVIDGDGRPPHSFEVYAIGGDEQTIAEAIFKAKPAGIETTGTISKTVVDSQGFSHVVKFSRPSDLLIYMAITITPNTDPNEGAVYPSNGDDLVKAALETYGYDFTTGEDVVWNRLFTPINSIDGVVGIVLKIGTSPGPTSSDNISVPATSIAQIAASRITINHP